MKVTLPSITLENRALNQDATNLQGHGGVHTGALSAMLNECEGSVRSLNNWKKSLKRGKKNASGEIQPELNFKKELQDNE